MQGNPRPSPVGGWSVDGATGKVWPIYPTGLVTARHHKPRRRVEALRHSGCASGGVEVSAPATQLPTPYDWRVYPEGWGHWFVPGAKCRGARAFDRVGKVN